MISRILSRIRPSNSEDLKPLMPLLVWSIMGRCGTTLMMQLLGTSPQIAFDRVYPFEVRYLSYLMRWSHLLKQEWRSGEDWTPEAVFRAPGEPVGPFPHPGSAFWNHQEMWSRCVSAAWTEFSRTVMNKCRPDGAPSSSPMYYAEKTPPWLPAAIRTVIPCKIILLVRDPRDIFLSINAFDRKRGFPGFNRRADDDDWSFARRFVKQYRDTAELMMKEIDQPYSILVRYEDLVSNLDSDARRLGSWLSVTLSAEQVVLQTPDFAHHMTSSSPRESVGRWQREMPVNLNAFFLSELSPELRRFGFAT